MTANISMFRCANCGSSSVEPYMKGKKINISAFSLLKAKEINEFRCPQCGCILNYSMADADKVKVDTMVFISPETKESLHSFMNQYNNIEYNPVLLNLG